MIVKKLNDSTEEIEICEVKCIAGKKYKDRKFDEILLGYIDEFDGTVINPMSSFCLAYPKGTNQLALKKGHHYYAQI